MIRDTLTQELHYLVASSNALDYIEGRKDSYGLSAIQSIKGLVTRVEESLDSGKNPEEFFFFAGIEGEYKGRYWGECLTNIRQDLEKIASGKLEYSHLIENFLHALRQMCLHAGGQQLEGPRVFN